MWLFRRKAHKSENKGAPASFSERQKKDKSPKYFHAEAVAASVENAGNGYQSPSLIAVGAQAQEVAASTSVSNLAFSFLLLKVLPLIHARTSTKKATLVIALISALGWLPLILAFLVFGQVSPSWLIALWMVSLIPAVMLVPLRDNWMGDIVSAGRMGRYLGLRAAISAGAYLGIFFLMGHVLDTYSGQISSGYAIIFIIAFAASFSSFILFKIIRAPAGSSTESATNFGFRDFIKETRRSNLGSVLLYLSVFTFAVNLASPFFVVYMFNTLHFSYLTYTMMVASEYSARMLSLGFWGRYLDRAGGLKVLRIVSHLIPFLPILWLFSSSIVYLLIVQFLSGALWAAFDVSNQAYIYQAAPEEKRFRFILYSRSLTTLSVALGALAGGFLLNYVPPIFGSSILGIFLISGLIRLVVVFCMLPKMETSAVKERRPAVPPHAPRQKAPATKGLFYQPKLWADYLSQVLELKAELRRKTSPVAEQSGLFYQPKQWLVYYPKLEVPITRVAARETRVNTGLFHQPEQWLEYYSAPESKPVATVARAKPFDNELFYNPALWTGYSPRAVASRKVKAVGKHPPKPLYSVPGRYAGKRLSRAF